MISTRKKFIFIHIPKTGGNAIQRSLLPYADDQLSTDNPYQDGIHRFGLTNRLGLEKHAALTAYKKALPKESFDNFYKFSCIRNPWERAISYYFSPHRGKVVWDKDRFIEIIGEMPSVSHYIKLPGSQNQAPDSDIDFLMRFEHLERDFEAVCSHLDIATPPLPKLNVSSKRHYAHYYDAALVRRIEEIFSDEISFGNYKFDTSS